LLNGFGYPKDVLKLIGLINGGRALPDVLKPVTDVVDVTGFGGQRWFW
jgi:hypothetical protein